MLTTYHHSVPLSRNLGTLTSWNPLGLSRSVMGLLYLYLYLKSIIFHVVQLTDVQFSYIQQIRRRLKFETDKTVFV